MILFLLFIGASPFIYWGLWMYTALHHQNREHRKSAHHALIIEKELGLKGRSKYFAF